MQDESVDLCSSAMRLERLRVATQATWAEVAESLGLSESMIYQAKSGKRSLSGKALYRLATAEIKAGILPPLLAKVQSRNQETEGRDPDGVIREVFSSEAWGADTEAQFAAILGKDLLGSALLMKWKLLEDWLVKTFDVVDESIGWQRRLFDAATKGNLDPEQQRELAASMDQSAGILREGLPDLKKQLADFGRDLERLADQLPSD